MRKSLLILFIFYFSTISAQDLTGLWKGTMYNDTTQLYYKYEIAISEKKGKLYGYSHTYFIFEEKQYYGVKKLNITQRDGKLYIESTDLIANNYPVAPPKNVRQYNELSLEVNDSMMMLKGPFHTNRTKQYAPATGMITLMRRVNYRQSALVPHLEELGRVNDLSFVKPIETTPDETKIIYARNEKPLTEEPKEMETVKLNTNSPVKTDKNKVEQTKANVKEEIIQLPEKEIAKADATPENKEIKSSITHEAGSDRSVAIVRSEESKIKEQVKNDKVSGKENTSAVQKENVKENTEEHKTIIKQAEIISKPPASDIVNRKTIVQETVYFKSDSLRISLYDNGEVDGDTVSVMMNGAVILAKQRLSTTAVSKTIYVDSNTKEVQLVMYAENLGSIAPNSGLMVVRDGREVYEIRFSGDLSQNAAILFKRKE